jgi:hypothetical protein
VGDPGATCGCHFAPAPHRKKQPGISCKARNTNALQASSGMSEPSVNSPATPAAIPLPRVLEEVFFAPLREVMRADIKTRSCKALEDEAFVALNVLRVLQSSKSGRDFIQSHGIPNFPGLNLANYFGSLGSKRRLALITATHQAMTRRLRPALRENHDLLATLPELDGWEVWAGDGHAIAHATHDERNGKDAFSPVHGIYKLDLRTGWAGFIDLCRPTATGVEHELTTLKRQDKDQLRCGAIKGRSTLLDYDKAIVDFQWSYNLKQSKSIYLVTGWKENFAPMTVMPQAVDAANPANALVIADETVYFNNTPGVWRRITAGCPDSNGLYVTLTNQMTLPPGVINQVRRLRWNIEKAFNQHERKLEEDKAWTANQTGKRIQALSICIAHNLLRLFGARIEREEGIVDTKVIKAWHQRLAARADAAVKAGRQLPHKLYESLYRPTEVSLQFIRWLRSALHRPTCYREALALLRPLMERYL